MLAEDVARALGVPAPTVAVNLPQILSALEQFKTNDHATRVAALATIGTEVPGFAPIPEYAGGWEYEGRSDLGNVNPGDGPRYKGRGFIQLTGRANYRTYGNRLGLDLEGNPDLALDVHIAALVLAVYFVDRGIPAMAAAAQWGAVRVAVNGGYNGWPRFIQCVDALENIHDVTVPVVHKLTHDTILRHFPEENSPPIHSHDTPTEPAVFKAGETVVVVPDKITPHWVQVNAPNMYTGWVLRAIVSNI